MAGDYDTFIRDSDKQWCWACGRDHFERAAGWCAPWFLQRAHVASGGCVRARVEDVRAINILCPRCHALNHGSVIRCRKDKLPTISTASMLWIKRARDPDNWDLEFLRSIWLGNPPDPEPPHDWFLHEYDTRRECGWKNWW